MGRSCGNIRSSKAENIKIGDPVGESVRCEIEKRYENRNYIMTRESNIQNMPVNTYLFNKHLTGVVHLKYCKPDSLLSDCSDMEQFTF